MESLDAERIRVLGDPEPDRVHRFVQVGRLVPERRILAHLSVRTARTRSLPSHARFMESLLAEQIGVRWDPEPVSFVLSFR
jgi:hypothetical protein